MDYLNIGRGGLGEGGDGGGGEGLETTLMQLEFSDSFLYPRVSDHRVSVSNNSIATVRNPVHRRKLTRGFQPAGVPQGSLRTRGLHH